MNPESKKKTHVFRESAKPVFFDFWFVVAVAGGSLSRPFSNKMFLFLRKGAKGGIANLIVFTRNLQDLRLSGRPGKQQMEETKACGI